MADSKEINQIAIAAITKGQNKIVRFFQTNSIIEHAVKDSIGNEVVFLFLVAACYFFSAIEEIDWNVYSADSINDEEVTDNTIWNIYQLADIAYGRIMKLKDVILQ